MSPVTSESPPRQPPLAVRIQQEAARRLGLETEILDPEYGYLFEVRGRGRRRVLYGGRSPLNDAVAARVCEDKFFTELVLRRAGFSTTRSVRCLSPDDVRTPAWAGREGLKPALDFAERNGYPLIVKPNRFSHGLGVRPVSDEAELQAAVADIWRYDYCVLVQLPVPGMDLRLNFLDGEFLAGYRRAAVEIVGDGARSLRELLVARDERFADEAFWERVRRDPIWEEQIASKSWDESTILPPGKGLRFETPVLNLNRWAVGEVLPEIDAAWLTFGRRLGDLFRLRHFGVDLRVPGPEADPEQAVVIEVNSSPLLTQLYNMGYQEAALAAQMRVMSKILEL